MVPAASASAPAASESLAADSLIASASAADVTLWATCAVMFGGAFVTGLPALLWWKDTAGQRASAGGPGSILQGLGVRMLSAGLMLGSGLGVVVPEGFFAFAEGAQGEAQGLPEWCAGAALAGGFVGMLVLQWWLEGRGPGCSHHRHHYHHHHHHHHHRHDNNDNHSLHSRRLLQGSDGVAGYQQVPISEPVAAPEAAPHDVEATTDVAAPAAAATASTTMELISRRTGCTTGVAIRTDDDGDRRVGGVHGVGIATATAYISLTAGGDGDGDGDGHNDDGEPAARRRRRRRRWDARNGLITPSTVSSSTESFATAESCDGGGGGPRGGTAWTAGGGGGTAVEALTAASSSSAQLALGGLLVHSAADGLAVGAASLGSGTSGGSLSLTVTVAAAIMAHKLPVTLGLTTYLRQAGWRRGRVVRGLLAFSASAPVAALATFYLLQLLLLLLPGSTPPEAGGGSSSSQAIALAVLFSGGTFLAAATQHILPAALQAPAEQGMYGQLYEEDNSDEEGDRAAERSRAATDWRERAAARAGTRGSAGSDALPLVLLAAGAVLPLLIAALIPEVD